ncbi:HAMP domain-containing protein [Vogesella oryzae]|uniref:HAMP domain-containing protein n=1 Tax=Vogesella oryzae TaxID=1735285 RepID=UPI00158223DB|nr:HAMP domain-containing protein [Vogesella oryzae]
MRIKHHLLLWLVLGSLLPLLLVVGIGYERFVTHYRLSAEAQLQALLSVRLNEIANWWQSQTTMLQLLTADNDLVACLRAPVLHVHSATTAARGAVPACDFEQQAHILAGHNDLLLLDARGKVIYSPDHPAWLGADLTYPAQSSSRMASQLQELIDMPSDGVRLIPHARFAPLNAFAAFWLSPVLQQGKLQGFLMLRVNDEQLRRITGNYAGMGTDGENLLVTRQDNGNALVVSPLRNTANAAFRLRITPQMQAGQAMWGMLAGGVGSGYGIDFRGRPVLAAWSALPLLGGGIMLTRDEAAVMAPLREQLYQRIAMLLLATIFSCAVTFWFARKLVLPINKLLDASRRLGRGERGVRLAPLYGHEFGLLGSSFNVMAEQIERSQLQRQLQLGDAERMALSTVPLTNGVIVGMFGIKNLGMLSGAVFFSHQVGSFLGVWLGGLIYDRTGNYDLVWGLSIALGVAAALANLPVKETLAAPAEARA